MSYRGTVRKWQGSISTGTCYHHLQEVEIEKKQNRNVHGHRRTRAAGLTNPENVVNIRICRLDVDFKY